MFNLGTSSSRTVPPKLLSIAKLEINSILSNVHGVHFVMLCSTDGFELALANKKNVNNNGKIAAVSSSILAMVTAFISEINLKGCQTVTLDAENGKAILTSIPAKNNPMLIVTVTDKDILLGQLFYSLNKATETIVAADV